MVRNRGGLVCDVRIRSIRLTVIIYDFDNEHEPIWNFMINHWRDEDQSVSHVVQAILGLPDQVHVAVKSTSIRLIGELAEWLNKHPQFIGIYNIHIT